MNLSHIVTVTINKKPSNSKLKYTVEVVSKFITAFTLYTFHGTYYLNNYNKYVVLHNLCVAAVYVDAWIQTVSPLDRRW